MDTLLHRYTPSILIETWWTHLKGLRSIPGRHQSSNPLIPFRYTWAITRPHWLEKGKTSPRKRRCQQIDSHLIIKFTWGMKECGSSDILTAKQKLLLLLCLQALQSWIFLPWQQFAFFSDTKPQFLFGGCETSYNNVVNGYNLHVWLSMIEQFCLQSLPSSFQTLVVLTIKLITIYVQIFGGEKWNPDPYCNRDTCLKQHSINDFGAFMIHLIE